MIILSGCSTPGTDWRHMHTPHYGTSKKPVRNTITGKTYKHCWTVVTFDPAIRFQPYIAHWKAINKRNLNTPTDYNSLSIVQELLAILCDNLIFSKNSTMLLCVYADFRKAHKFTVTYRRKSCMWKRVVLHLCAAPCVKNKRETTYM